MSKSAAALLPAPTAKQQQSDEERSLAVPESTELDLADAFRLHYSFVWRTIVCMGVPNAAIDDAVQDVFMVAYRRRNDYDGRAPIKSWLFGIARFVSRNHRRRAAKATQPLPDAAALGPETIPDTQLARREAAVVVQDFLTQLDDRQRDVFVLAHLEGMTAPEIAKILGVKLNTVYSRLRLARRRFEDAVARHRARDQRRLHG